MAEIVAIPAILAFPPEVYAQLFSKSYQDPVAAVTGSRSSYTRSRSS